MTFVCFYLMCVDMHMLRYAWRPEDRDHMGVSSLPPSCRARGSNWMFLRLGISHLYPPSHPAGFYLGVQQRTFHAFRDKQESLSFRGKGLSTGNQEHLEQNKMNCQEANSKPGAGGWGGVAQWPKHCRVSRRI